MHLDPAAPLRDHSKPCYRDVDKTQVTRYCGFYARAKEPSTHRAEQHRAAGSEASAIGEGFRKRGCIEQAIRWHLQDAWHHHASFDYARHDAEREAAVVGEVDAWGAVAACCKGEADGDDGMRPADERLEWLQRRCAYYHRAMLAAERPGGGAGGLVKQHGQSAALPGHRSLPGPPGTRGSGPGQLHAFWARASTAQTPVAAHGAAVGACQSRRYHCLIPSR